MGLTNNVVLCSDGTGNSDTEGRGTNVFKLYEAVDIHGHLSQSDLPRQIAFYDDGVGTENFALHKAIGAAFGWGFKQNVCDLYTALVHVYTPGDKLFLFGFSRGGYTIRAVSGLIQYCGVLNRQAFVNEEELKEGVDECWNAFEKVAFPRFLTDKTRRTAQPAEEDEAVARQRRKGLGSHERSVGIHFIGVWDTVGAVGMPVDELKPIVNWICPRKFDEHTPGKEVHRACHALSIDDERRTFYPELWNEKGAPDGQIEQVWFAGVHSNVGGGYPKHGMSLVTLDWMMTEAEKCGLRFTPAARNYVQVQKDVHSKLYDSRSGLAVYYRWEPRDIVEISRTSGIERPKVHESVFERIAFRTDGYAPCNIPAALDVVNGPKPRTQEVCKLVCDSISSLSVHSLLDLRDIRGWVWLGKLSYFGFLGLSLFAVGWGLYMATPVPDSTSFFGRAWEMFKASLGVVTSPGQLWDMLVEVVTRWWWFIPLMALCYVVSLLVDYMMEKRFSEFWHERRERLREIFS